MISRHFRDKDDEYFNFNITTTSVDQLVRCTLGVNYSVMNGGSKHRIDWGDGSKIEPLDSSSSITHTYGSTGSYVVKVWTREKYKAIDQVIFNQFPLSDSVLDLSNFKYLRYIFLPVGGVWVGTYSIPTEYNGSSPLLIKSIASNGILSNPDGILDITPWTSYDEIYFFGGDSTLSLKRILVNPFNNINGLRFVIIGGSITSVGPSASDLSNRTVDLTGLKIDSDLTIRNDLNLSDSFDQILLPSSSFSPSGVGSISISGASFSSIDLSQVIWTSSNSKSLSVEDCHQLTNVINPTYGITGSFNDIGFSKTDLTYLDLSSYYLSSGCNVDVDDTSVSSITFATSSSTSFVYLRSINSSLSVAPNFNDVPNATEINNSSIFLHNCSLDVVNVNKILVDLDTNSTNSFTGRSINLSGNTAPDGSSGGFDGLTAKANLISKGFTVTTD